MKLYDAIVADKKNAPDDRTKKLEPQLYHPHRRSHRKHIVVYGAFFAFLVAVYSLGIIFAHAKVTIYERKIPFTLDRSSIDLEHESTASGPERLSYQAMVVDDTLTREVFGSKVTVADSKAKGEVVFFNEYSTSSISISSGTTLVTAEGKKYLTQEKVTIPGYTTDKATKTKQPGSSKPVSIIAAASGSDYNTSGTTFSVAVYTGTKKTQVYARSSSAISGGESGARHTVNDDEKNTAVSLLTSQLEERLKRQTRPQIPQGYMTYPELQLFFPDQNSLILQGQGIKFPASLSGSLVTYLIPQTGFEQAIAHIALGDRTFPKVAIPSIAELTVVPASALPSSTTNFPDTLSLSISGQGTIIAKADQGVVKNNLLGIKKSRFDASLEPITEIDHATYSIFPFWAPYFPTNADRIKIVVQ
jgi:hypothetical protein